MTTIATLTEDQITNHNINPDHNPYL